MQQIFNAKCSFIIDGDTRVSSWDGSFLLDDDGWFEGIVNDTSGIYQGDNFIFGVHIPGKGIELYKLAPIDIRYPMVFHGDIAGNVYMGELENVTLLGPTHSGASNIVTREKQYDDDIVQELESKINSYKTGMDDICALFYGRYLEIRDALCQIFSRNFEGKYFTAEEADELMKVLGPMNEKVLNETAQEAACQYLR